MSATPLPPSPYPGLRAFRQEEALIFGGRGEHRAEVLDLLGGSRFLAVVGASGSGKSSFVLAGLLPDIREGQLIGVDPETVRIASMQPGLRPFANLADVLKKELKTDLAIEPILRRGPLGLAQLLDEVENEPDRALVLVVDQFEEIFRFASLSNDELLRHERGSGAQPLLDGADNEAQAFVSLLLQSSVQNRHPVYVLLTMRSDFLARCDQFSGLPEAISRSQFLTPRLNRQQLEQAITRPPIHYGASVQPALAGLILNQVSPEQDQLPLLQHALARTWERAKARCAGGPIEITVQDYKDVGGFTGALNRHGNEICARLARERNISEASIERFFRVLAHHDSSEQVVRRPARIVRIEKEAVLPAVEVHAIADAFRAEGCHLLMPPTTRVPELKEETVLDISHESLLRQWEKMREWMAAEWRQRLAAGELVRSMQDWEEKVADYEAQMPSAIGKLPKVKAAAMEPRKSWLANAMVSDRLYLAAHKLLFDKTNPAVPQGWMERYAVDEQRMSSFWTRVLVWRRAKRILIGVAVIVTLLLIPLYLSLSQIKEEKAQVEEQRKKVEAALDLAKREAAEAKLAGASFEESSRDGVQKLSLSTTEYQNQFEKLNQIIETALQKPEARTEQILTLLDDPAIRGLLALSFDPTKPPDPIDVTGAARLSEPQVLGKDRDVYGIAFLGGQPELQVLTQEAPDLKLCKLTGEPVRVLATDPGGFPPLYTDGTGDALAAEGPILRYIARDGSLRTTTVTPPAEGTATTGTLVNFGGKRLVLFGTTSGEIGSWDTVQDSKVQIFPSRETDRINSVQFSAACGALLASAENWTKVWFIPPNSSADSLLKFRANSRGYFHETLGRFSPDGRILVTAGSRDKVPMLIVRLLDQKTFTDFRGLVHRSPITHVVFSPDDKTYARKMLATADDGGRIYLWDLEAMLRPPASNVQQGPPGVDDVRAVSLFGHRKSLTSLVWARNTKYLFSAGEDGLSIAWQFPDQRVTKQFNGVPYLLPSQKSGVKTAALSPDGRFIATANAEGHAQVYPLFPTIRGKVREWSGPKPEGTRVGGDLALVTDADVNTPRYQGIFRDENSPRKGLAYRLNPDAIYVNARWDYTFTPRPLLRSTKVRVWRVGPDGKRVGDPLDAIPVDWGPPARSGFDLDLSPGLIRQLGLKEGDLAEMQIPLIPDKPPTKQQKEAAQSAY